MCCCKHTSCQTIAEAVHNPPSRLASSQTSNLNAYSLLLNVGTLSRYYYYQLAMPTTSSSLSLSPITNFIVFHPSPSASAGHLVRASNAHSPTAFPPSPPHPNHTNTSNFRCTHTHTLKMVKWPNYSAQCNERLNGNKNYDGKRLRMHR